MGLLEVGDDDIITSDDLRDEDIVAKIQLKTVMLKILHLIQTKKLNDDLDEELRIVNDTLPLILEACGFIESVKGSTKCMLCKSQLETGFFDLLQMFIKSMAVKC